MTDFNRYRSALQSCNPPERLNGEVLERVRSLRAEQERRTSRSTSSSTAHKTAAGLHARSAVAVRAGSSAVISRRGFVVAGAAACLGVGALGVGLSSRMGADGAASSVEAGVPDRLFGLAIAQAVEPGESVALETRPNSLIPIGDELGPYLAFKMNLACMGEGIEELTYTIVGSPVAYSNLGPQWGNNEYKRVCFGTMLDPRVGYEMQDARAASEGWISLEEQERRAAALDSLVVDCTAEPDWNGEMQTEWGMEYRIINVTSTEEFWALDPILTAKHVWMDTACSGGFTAEDLAALEDAYRSQFNEVAASYDSLYAWLRSCHAAALALAADTLAMTTLQIEARFAGGATALKSYRLAPVADIEDVANGRFDALVERFGLGETAFDSQVAPFYNFKTYVPEDDEADARLTRPLFTITDVTEQSAAE